MEEVCRAILQSALDFSGGKSDCKAFLENVVNFLVQNINHIPRDLLSPLLTKRSTTKITRSRKDEALEHIRSTTRQDITCSNHMRHQLEQLRQCPSAFLDGRLRRSPRQDNANVLSILYDKNREAESDYALTRSFSTTALYILAKDIIDQMGYNRLTGRALYAIVSSICRGQSGSDDWKIVEGNVKKDFDAGSRWYGYSQALGGYGCFFFLPRLPMTVYEVFLNKGDNFTFAIGHFTILGLPGVVKATAADQVGEKIMSDIRLRFTSSTSSISSIQPPAPNLIKKRPQNTPAKRAGRARKRQRSNDHRERSPTADLQSCRTSTCPRATSNNQPQIDTLNTSQPPELQSRLQPSAGQEQENNPGLVDTLKSTENTAAERQLGINPCTNRQPDMSADDCGDNFREGNMDNQDPEIFPEINIDEILVSLDQFPGPFPEINIDDILVTLDQFPEINLDDILNKDPATCEHTQGNHSAGGD